MSEKHPHKVSVDDVAPNTRRGGDLRTLLTPTTVGATAGFMGVVTLEPREFVSEHYHPYSEEFLYLVNGELDVRLDGETVVVSAGEAIMVPRDVRHRLVNNGDEQVRAVFHLGPLAPRPELGHVDTEPYPEAASAETEVVAR